MFALRRPTSVTPSVVLLAGAAAAVKATPLVRGVVFPAERAARNHKRFMIGTFLGLAAAAVGALMPGRTLFFLFWGPQ